MKIKKFYYIWGNEKSGYVSTGEYDRKGEVILTGQMPREKAITQGRVFTCPFN